MATDQTPEAAGFDSRKLEALDAAMEAFVDSGKVPGIATLIARNGHVLQHRCHGWLEIDKVRPVQQDSIFRIASLTKAVTASAVMQLHEAERLSLDQAVTRWLPEFAALRVFQPLEDGHYELARLERPITVRHLLTHTAGFSYGFEPDDPVAPFYQAAELLNRSLTISPALPDLIKRLAQIPLAFQPGTAWRYSMAYDVLGRLIELIADRPFESYLREHIFEPLGMVDTGFSVAPDQLDRFGSLYSGPYEHGSQVLDEAATSEYRAPGVVPSGGGGLVSTLPDFYRFMSMLLNWGELEGRRLLRQESVAQMITNQVAGHVRQAQGYGFGLSVQSEAQRPPGWPSGLFGHSGGTGTEAFGSREAGLVTIIMYQAANYREPMNRFRELAFAALLPDPPSPANGWP